MITKQSLGKVAICLKGAYNNSVQYTVFDLVSYDGSSYLAIQDTIGNPPTGNSEYWQLIAVGGGGAAAIDENSILYWPDVT